MNTISELLNKLRKRGIQLWLENDELRFRAAKGSFDANLREEVKAHKEAIKAFLRTPKSAVELSPIPKAEPRKYYPLSHAQQRLWFLNRFEPTPSVYHCPAVIEMDPALPASLLEKALNLIEARHPSLRTRYLLDADQPMQQVVEPGMHTLPVHDFRTAPDPITAAEQRAAEMVRAPFDLEEGPLWRAELLILGDDSCCLVWVIHHIATDGWSMGILARELAEICVALAEGRPPHLDEPPIEYTDYACWHTLEVEQRIVPQQLDYWINQLRDAPPETTLPTDFPRPAIRNGHGHVYRSQLPRHLTELVENTARAHAVTPFMLMLAAFKLLIMHYSGQQDLVVGTPSANRPHPQLAGVVGCFVNTLALRSQLSREETFSKFLQRVRNTCIDAYTHQELPFELLVEHLGVGRSLSHSPLFQIMFSLQNAAEELGVGKAPIELRQEIAKFDLNLTLTLSEGRYAVECEYDIALFEETSITRLLNHYACLLESVCRNSTRRLGEYRLLSAKEQHQLEVISRGVEDNRPLHAVHPAFFELVRHQPDAPALRDSDHQLSYKELGAMADNLALQLREAGLRPGNIATLCLERSVEMVVGILAVLRCGAAYLPIDPDSPTGRITFTIEDAGTDLVLVQNHLAKRVRGCRARVLEFGTDLTLDTSPPPPAEWPEPMPAALAYVIYTSGTTGRPKGAAIQHGALDNRLRWMQDNHGIGPGDRVLQKTNYAFDVSVWEFLWPLTRGAELVLAKPGGHRDPAYLAQLIEREAITICHFVPSMLTSFLEVAEAGQLASLRALFTSGEVLAASTRAAFLAKQPNAHFYNLYGPTEAAIDVSVWNCRDTPVREGLVPIGQPITNIQLLVLDPDLNPLPKGLPGELYIGGVGLAAGYLNRPGLTAECFVPHPKGQPGERLYRTGDRVRWLADGTLEFLGRLDHQIKLRGLRIELGEIEYHLTNHPQVAMCGVVVRQAPSGDPMLVAYLQPENTPPTASELRNHLNKRVPDYMIPDRFEVMEQLPCNANGKLDRKRLASLPLTMTDTAVDYATDNPTEVMLMELWREVLQVERIGPEQNFFELGGNSLLMVKVHTALCERLERDVPLVKLFAHPTIRSLAHHLDQPNEIESDSNHEIENIVSGRQRLARMKARRSRVNA